MRNTGSSQVRAMRAGDLDAILAVQAQCYPPSMQEPAAVVQARMTAAAATCVVAVDGEGVCGYGFAYAGRLGVVTPLGAAFEPALDADTLYLHDLSVAPRAHGRGLARRLADHLLHIGREQGLRMSALVSVQESNGFWEAMGYEAFEHDCPAARAALAGYPGAARYMVRALTGPGAP